MATSIAGLRTLVANDQAFRQKAVAAARTVFQELASTLRSIVPMLGQGTSEYPIELDEQNPDHLVLLLGPKALHVCFHPAVAVMKELVYSLDNKPTNHFHEVAHRPAHESVRDYSVAIEFVRSSSFAFRQRNPGTALVFAVIYLGHENLCTIQMRSGLRELPRDQLLSKLPDLVAPIISDGLATGVSIWEGIRTIPYEALLEDRQLGMDEKTGERVRQHPIGFEPSHRDEDPSAAVTETSKRA